MSVGTGVEPTVDSVLEAIDSLESIKTRANEQKMITYLIKKHRLKTSSARDLINDALAEGYIDRLDSGSYIVSVQCKQPLEGSQHLNLNTNNKFKSKMEIETKCESKEENTIPDGASLLANQTITGAQKRQKKQSMAPVVLQRIRPISKRKKFKKSLGPDFLEPAELGMQYLRDTYEPKCDVCSLTMFSSSTSLNVFEELLHCNNCDAKAHPSCVNLNEEVAHKTQWQCHNCKVCTVCRRSDTNEFVIICMTCSKGFHVKCHLTAIVNRPKGNWYCKHCCSKGTTNSTSNSSHLTNGMNDKKGLYASDDSMQSEDNGTEETDKEDKNLNLVLENELNSEPNDKEREDSNESVDALKDEKTCGEETEDIVDNQTDCVSESIEISNGIDCVKEESAEEETNDLDNEVDNESNANPESGELNRCVNPAISPQKWSVEEVETFIRESGFPSESLVFKEQEIDGRSLLLLRRMDVLTGLSLKLGPALKIYNKISRLQGRDPSDHSNSC